MRDHEGDVRAFYDWSLKYPEQRKDGVIYEIGFGLYAPDGGTSGEMHMAWYSLGSDWCPRLEGFHDSMSALWQFKDILKELAKRDKDGEKNGVSPDEFKAILLQYGFEDWTNKEP